ncbi:immunoglobulin-like domain-containing receptor 2 isoform X2 [Gambusia affinis]|uniref:immunoglobulin-like domain-containing receptor 2 isoform X2 n=1 Tax=Gambusia affinis TaxID=33528 RepID=UPI001CDCA458|nr:immunoglobulin-like domain-containing receptor 2 isoform X2 [Gambusia affinis]
MWRIFILFLAGVIPPPCSGLHVIVRDEKRYATLFQSVVLPCQYTSVSTQSAMVKWIYKSYCRDRTRDSFSFPDSLSGGLGGGGLQSGSRGVGGGYEAGSTASHLDCSDNRRTVRTVASISGSSVTLSEYYKNRDVTIINTADLRIGEVQWGDSGVYFCQVTIADDIEGQNEASVELLVLGFSGVPEDLLPDIDLKIMPEWVFVVAVVLGSVLFLLLAGVCWCQCCPHSCCCYVSCWCCPDTCCCPRHLYEAGKGIKTGTSTPQTPAYPPYFVSGLPAMIPIAPPSLVDKVSTVPPSDGTLVAAVSPMPMQAVGIPYRVPSSQDQNSLRVLQYVEKQLAHFNPSGSNSKQSSNQSELSSLHEGDTNFHQTFRNVQKKALPAIPDQDSSPEPYGYRKSRSPDLQRHRKNPSSPHRYRHDPDSDHLDSQDEPLLPRRYSDDPPSSSQSHRITRSQRQQNSSDEDKHDRWNPRSEHLQRKTYHSSGRTVSLDELEEFATTYKKRGGRGAERGEEMVEYEMEVLDYGGYPSHRKGPPQHYYSNGDELDDNSEHEGHTRASHKSKHSISPLPSPKKRGNTRERERAEPPPPKMDPPSNSSQERDYDATFLNSLLERKAKLRGFSQGRNGTQAEDDVDWPSIRSGKKPSRESNHHCSRSPSNRPEADSPSPSNSERTRTERPSPRPLHANARSPPPLHSLPAHREEHRDKSRKVVRFRCYQNEN